uniref:cell division protein CrgA n=1 Tax=Vaginimicrobium propionicum TaxID=1871034 RepID=UPI0038CD4D54
MSAKKNDDTEDISAKERSGNPAKAAKAREEKIAKARAAANIEKRKDAPRDWVPYVFVPMGLLGVLWLIVFYIAGSMVPGMSALGNWNFAIGLALIAGSFGVATLWK